MALMQTAQEPQAGRVFHGELYVAGVEGPEWLMGHRVWSLYMIGSKGNYRFYLTDRHVTGQGAPTMGQRLHVTAQWAKFASVKLCFITQYRVLSDPLPR